MYAILDIETTGGKFNEEGITEIAVYRYNGQEVVDQLSSLVNPLRDIQPFVERLTGINSKMLVNAPKFFELAKRIIEITEGCVIVAHNAEFDYRILQTEFRRLGYAFQSQSLCTVALSQKLLPDAESYKLGNLVRSLGIPITDRHRAHGDALATLELFKLLLEKDSGKEIISTYVKELNKNKVSPKFLNIIEELPSEIGVYYIHDSEGNIIYIGKSKNIKKQTTIMKNIFFTLFIIILLSTNSYAAGSGGSGNENTTKTKSNYEKAVSYIKSAKKYEKKDKTKKANKKYEKALGLLIKSNEEKPNQADTLNYLGFTTRKLGDYAGGEKYYLQGLAIEPNHNGINEYLGELYVVTNRIDLAKERLDVLKSCNCEEYKELKVIIAGEKKSKY